MDVQLVSGVASECEKHKARGDMGVLEIMAVSSTHYCCVLLRITDRLARLISPQECFHWNAEDQFKHHVHSFRP